jgi:rhodanese-related sulfurtransferase
MPSSLAQRSKVTRWLPHITRSALSVAVLALLLAPSGCKRDAPTNSAGAATQNPYPNTAALRAAMKAGKVVVVDVRTPDEWRRGRIPGAKHIPLSEVAKRASELPKDKDIVTYCAVGARSAAAARILKRLGYQRVFNFGGLSDWKGTIDK